MKTKIYRAFNKHTESVTSPLKAARDIGLYRCEGCFALNTSHSLRKFSGCWRCGARRVRGGSWSNPLQLLALHLYLDLPFFAALKAFRDWRKRRSGNYEEAI